MKSKYFIKLTIDHIENDDESKNKILDSMIDKLKLIDDNLIVKYNEWDNVVEIYFSDIELKQSTKLLSVIKKYTH
jgi:hypothetical protein